MKVLIALFVLYLLLHKSSDSKPKKNNKSRPWYDISYDDMIMYDIFDND